jgi:uncharacterized protein (DUF302 family)
MIDAFAYRLETQKAFSDVVDDLQTQTAEHQFRVQAVHDVQATLAEKGIERDPITIVEVCNAGFANQALSKDMNVSLFMPCRYSVFTEEGKTVVVLGRPTLIAQMMPEAGLDELAAGVEDTLKNIMHAAIGEPIAQK